MSNNQKKSRRTWKYSGYKQCSECCKHGYDGFHYDTWTSTHPHKVTLCHACYEYIYKHDRKEQPTPCCPWYHKPSLFDDIGG